MMKSIKEILSKDGINFTAAFEEDRHSLETFRVPNLVAFLCTLRKDNQIIAEGRGMSILGKTSRWVEKSIQGAKNASLIDAVVKSTKVLEAMQSDNRLRENSIVGSAYRSAPIDADEPISERQRSYLSSLISTNVGDDDERERWMSNLDSMTKADASEAIAEFANR